MAPPAEVPKAARKGVLHEWEPPVLGSKGGPDGLKRLTRSDYERRAGGRSGGDSEPVGTTEQRSGGSAAIGLSTSSGEPEGERNFATEATSPLCPSWRKHPSGQSLMVPEDFPVVP